MVVVVMVVLLCVCDLQAGFPLWPFAISRVCPRATWRTLLKEVGHVTHLQRRGEERRKEERMLALVTLGNILPTEFGVQACKGYRGGKGWAGNCDYMCLDRSVRSC